jgi:predicted nucleotidyltransferase
MKKFDKEELRSTVKNPLLGIPAAGFFVSGYDDLRFSGGLPMAIKINYDAQQLQKFCEEQKIKRLALFGSVLRDDFSPTSDVDVLVEFEEGQTPSLLWWPDMLEKLSKILGGRRVDLVTLKSLSPRLKPIVLAEAVNQYVQKR